MFIPMVFPVSNLLPNYVTLDPHSQWHVSALLSTAFESMTLPSRLKAQNMSLQTLDQFENALNINGNQNIAKLRMGIAQNSAPTGQQQSARLQVHAQSRDMRLPSQEQNQSRAVDEEDPSIFDIDLFPAEEQPQSRGRSSTRKTHVFGQAENYRGDDDPNDEAIEYEDDGPKRARQRAASLTLVHK